MKRTKKEGQVQAGRSTSSSETNNPQTSELQVAAKKIRQLHESVLRHARHALDEAIRIGGLLVKVKDKLEHGQWLPWLKSNVPFHENTARNYMRCFENRALLKSTNVVDLSEAYALIAGTGQREKPKRRTPPAPVYEKIYGKVVDDEVDQEQQKRFESLLNAREDEDPLVVELAQKIVSTGFHVLSVKMHPDKNGGSDDAQRRLNAGRKLLQDAFASPPENIVPFEAEAEAETDKTYGLTEQSRICELFALVEKHGKRRGGDTPGLTVYINEYGINCKRMECGGTPERFKRRQQNGGEQ